jgi:hypothetical protein
MQMPTYVRCKDIQIADVEVAIEDVCKRRLSMVISQGVALDLL